VPTGTTNLPPTANCLLSSSGINGAAAVTMILLNGAYCFQPRVPSPSLIFIFIFILLNNSNKSLYKSGILSTENTLAPNTLKITA